MSLLNKLFENNKNSTPNNENAKTVLELNEFIEKLLGTDSYIAKSDYRKKIDSSKEVVNYFNQLKNDGLLSDFCKKNKTSENTILTALKNYSDIEELVTKHNSDFIQQKLKSEKDYLDTILKDVDPNIMLDEDQRKVVLTDEDYCLVIA